MIHDEQLKSIAAAVVLQAAKDYEDMPFQRDAIEKWIKDGNLYLDVVLPDISEDVIIKKLRNTIKTHQEK